MVFVLHWLTFPCGNRSQILLLWWHTVCGISPSRYGSLSKSGLFSNSLWIWVIWGKYMSLIWSYSGQEVRKCSSVSISFCGQCVFSWEPSLPTAAYLNSKAMLTESVHSQSFPLSLGQSQWSGILPLCTLCLVTNNILVCSVFFWIILSNVSSNYRFVFSWFGWV